MLKSDWPKKDQKFSIVTDISEAEIEIGDITEVKVVDFTKCSYDVVN